MIRNFVENYRLIVTSIRSVCVYSTENQRLNKSGQNHKQYKKYQNYFLINTVTEFDFYRFAVISDFLFSIFIYSFILFHFILFFIFLLNYHYGRDGLVGSISFI